MPYCNGIEASRAMRAEVATRGIAIIAFTALDEEEVRRQLKVDPSVKTSFVWI